MKKNKKLLICTVVSIMSLALLVWHYDVGSKMLTFIELLLAVLSFVFGSFEFFKKEDEHIKEIKGNGKKVNQLVDSTFPEPIAMNSKYNVSLPQLPYRSVYYQRGCELLDRNRYAESLEQFQLEEQHIKHMDFHTDNKITSYLAKICFSIGIVYFLLHRNSDAKRSFEYAIKNYNDAGLANSDDIAKVHYQLSKLYIEECNYDDAILELNQAISIYEKNSTVSSELFVYAYFDIAEIMLILFKIDEAWRYYVKAKDKGVLVKQKEKKLDAIISIRMGYIHFIKGRYKNAEDSYHEAKQFFEWSYFNGVGEINIAQYEFKKAVVNFERALKYCNRDNTDCAIILINLSNTYGILKEYQKSFEFALEAKKLRGKSFKENNLFFSEACCVLGLAYVNLGEYEKAEKEFILAERCCIGEQHPLVALISSGYGTLYYGNNDIDKSIGCFEKACKILMGHFGEKSIWNSFLYHKMGNVSKKQDIHKAIYYMDKAYEIIGCHFKSPNINLFHIACKIADLYAFQDSETGIRKSICYYDYALDNTSHETISYEKTVHIKIGDAYLRLGNWDNANRVYLSAYKNKLLSNEEILSIADKFYGYWWRYAINWYSIYESITGIIQDRIDIIYNTWAENYINKEEYINARAFLLKARERTIDKNEIDKKLRYIELQLTKNNNKDN